MTFLYFTHVLLAPDQPQAAHEAPTLRRAAAVYRAHGGEAGPAAATMLRSEKAPRGSPRAGWFMKIPTSLVGGLEHFLFSHILGC